MGGFGDRLRREREARGVTLGEISESTKISNGFLRALEQEDFEKLPGGIFNRGFVRAYCKFLGIDEEEMIADFDAAYGQYQAEQTPVAPIVPITDPESAKKNPTFSLAVLVPLILLIAGAIWWYDHARAATPTGNPESSPKSVESRSRTSSNASAEGRGSETNQNAKQKPAVPVKAGKASESVVAEAKTIAATPEVAAPVKPNTPIRLEVHANEDAWLSVIADGKTMMEGVLPATGTRKFRAQKNIYFTTGNAGGVEVSYNGRPLPSLGTNNEVRSLTFTQSGPRQ
jgi:cytoskeleton protein RodZ